MDIPIIIMASKTIRILLTMATPMPTMVIPMLTMATPMLTMAIPMLIMATPMSTMVTTMLIMETPTLLPIMVLLRLPLTMAPAMETTTM